jgi:hypothetical protein
MTTVTSIKVALVAIGIIVWAYGVRVDDRTFTWMGIGFLVVAFLLRFVGRRQPPAP